MVDHLAFIRERLPQLSYAELRGIAERAGVSESWLRKLKAGTYGSAPTYSRVVRVAEELRASAVDGAAQ